MRKWYEENIHLGILVVTLLLVIVGLIAIYSATYDAGSSDYFYRQIAWAVIGFFLMIIIMLVPFRTLQLISYPVYIISVLLLIGVLILGKTVAGSTSWFGVGKMGLQPSEIVKMTSILALAAYLSDKRLNLNRLMMVFKVSGIVFLPMILILLQPDMGTAIIYIGLLLPVMYWAGTSALLMITVIAPSIVAVAALFGTTSFLIVIFLLLITLFLMKENKLVTALIFSLSVLVGVSVQFIYGKLALYQQKRIDTFLNPENDPLSAGYNVIQAKVAIGSGGLFGKGFLEGSQTQLNFIPAQWTDFIYCVPAEEFGFLGAFFILGLFAYLLYKGTNIASTVKSRYASIVAIGVVSVFASHIVINIGMVMGIMPVIGVPLPFLSYGGSFLLTSLSLIGLLLNIYANRKEY
jgi:rod shape determining protein RodA